MKKRSLIAGLACGFVCVACVIGYTSTVQAETEAARNEAVSRYGGEQVDVIVARTDILPGETIGAGNTETRSWLVDLLPEDCVLATDDAWGKQAATFIAKGEVLVKKRFESGSMAIDVPAGMVALSVSTEEVAAVGGAVVPGSRVDVFAVGNSTTKLGSNMLVLATSSGDESLGRSSVDWITLALPPEKVKEYVKATETMSLYFALPASQGEASADPSPASAGDAKDAAEASKGNDGKEADGKASTKDG